MDETFDPQAELAFVTAVHNGDPSSTARLAERLRCVPRHLAVLLRRYTGRVDEDELAELTQDVVVVALRKLPEYEARAPFEAWVHRICTLTLMNRMRDQVRRRSRTEPGDHDPVDVRSEFERIERRESVLQLLDRLGGSEAIAVRLRHFEDKDFDAIAADLGVPRATAKTHYYRGIKKLRESLQDGDSLGEAI